MHEAEIRAQKIILFDGVCNLCNGSVRFILKYERDRSFRFASLQSDVGQELLKWCGLPPNYAEAVIYLENGIFHAGSCAALKIGQRLLFPWSILAFIGLLVPQFIRDWVYNQIGKHRYQWFGKQDICIVPTEKLKARILMKEKTPCGAEPRREYC
ncbi:MAG: DCC1-like thiol-disulfide oxidoreductase family protein [Anaerolineales bacterium]